MESVVLLKFNRGITELMKVVNCDAYVAVCNKQNLGSQPQSYRSQRGKYFEADGGFRRYGKINVQCHQDCADNGQPPEAEAVLPMVPFLIVDECLIVFAVQVFDLILLI